MTVTLGFRLMYFSDSPIMEKGLEKTKKISCRAIKQVVDAFKFHFALTFSKLQ